MQLRTVLLVIITPRLYWHQHISINYLNQRIRRKRDSAFNAIVDYCRSKFPYNIFYNDRIIGTVSKHIVANQPLTCTGKCIRIDESALLGIVITGLEIIESSLYFVDLAIMRKIALYLRSRKAVEAVASMAYQK